jgi:mannosyltransferase OCH1-like enzyme
MTGASDAVNTLFARTEKAAVSRDISARGSSVPTLRITAHIANRGDVRFEPGTTAIADAAGSTIEGFLIEAGIPGDPVEIEYRAVARDNTVTAVCPATDYCGTRGINLALTGVGVRTVGTLAAWCDCDYEGEFADGTRAGPFRQGATCQSATRAALVRLSVRLVARTPAAVAGPAEAAAVIDIPPFAALTRLMDTESRDGAEFVTVPRQELLNYLRYFLHALPLDEDLYLHLNPDVREAIAAGRVKSASQHFAAAGYFEGRPFSPYRDVEQYDLARPLYGVSEDYYRATQRGLRHLEDGDDTAAEACFREALRLHADGFHAQFHLGSLLLRAGRLGEGEWHLDRAREIDPRAPGPHKMLAQVAFILRQPERRLSHLEQFYALSPAPDRGAAPQIGLALAALGHTGRADSMLRAIPPQDRGGRVAATLPSLTRQVAEARRVLKQEAARLRADKAPAAAVAVAYRLAQLGRRRLARRVLAERLGCHDAAANAGSVLLLTEAIRLCNGSAAALAFLAEQPASETNLLLARADLLHEQGRSADVLALLQQHVPAARNERAMQLTALSHLRLRQDRQALDVCRIWHIATPDSNGWASAALFALAGLSALPSARVERPRPGAGERWPQAAPIPAAIMQFWDKPTPPDDVLKCIATWRDRNPGFVHRLFDDEAGRAFMAKTYGADAVAAWDHCHHPAMRSDFFRCGWLAVHGGFYADCDNVCRAPLAVALGRLSDKSLLLERTENGAIMNRFIACAPGHPAMRDMFAHVLAALTASARGGQRLDIWQGTGPGALTRAVGRRLLAEPSDRDAFLAATGIMHEIDCGRVQGEKNLAYKRTAAGNWRLAR